MARKYPTFQEYLAAWIKQPHKYGEYELRDGAVYHRMDARDQFLPNLVAADLLKEKYARMVRTKGAWASELMLTKPDDPTVSRALARAWFESNSNGGTV